MAQQDPPSPTAPPPTEAPVESLDALPIKPRIRPVDAYPVKNPDRDPSAPMLLALSDPSGLSPEPVLLPPMGAAVVELCDGSLTVPQILAEFQKRYRTVLPASTLEALLRKLDNALLLESPRFKTRVAQIYDEFARAEVRPAFRAGKSYPADPDALRAQLAGYFAPPNGPGLPAGGAHLAADAPQAPRAIIAPSVEFSRGGPAYAWAYRSLLLCKELPSLIVLLGSDHASFDPTVTLTRKHFATPLGQVDTDTAVLDQLLDDANAASGELPGLLLGAEHRHRSEHSLEHQLVWLRYVLDRRSAQREEPAPKVLAVLCGSLGEFVGAPDKDGKHDPMRAGPPESLIAPFIRLLHDRLEAVQREGRSVLLLCSADLAHVGPRFGDEQPIGAADYESLERRDRETLRPVVHGDGDGWFGEIRRERDARRVLGLSPIYTLLKAATPPLSGGQLRCYAQCEVDAGSVVSIASVVY